MKLQKSFKLAVNILLHSKLRSWLTIIGIVIGVAAIVAIVSIGEGAQANVQARLGGLGADLITVSPGFQRASGGFRNFGGGGGSGTIPTKNLTDKDLQVIKSVNGVAFVDGIISKRADVYYLAEKASLSVMGVSDPLALKNIMTTALDSGRYLNSGDTNVVIIGNSIALKTYKQPLAINRDLMINGKPFKIVGILAASGGIGGEDNRIYMPIEPARDVLNVSRNYYDSISIKATDLEMVDSAVNETQTKLTFSRGLMGKKLDFSVTSSKQTQAQIQSVTQTFTIFLAAIAAVSLIVGAVGIANTMFTSVLEKTKEIGVMKAIGARNSDIMVVFLMNSGLVGFVGGAIGISIGAAVSSALPSLLGRVLGTGVSVTTVIPTSLLVEAMLVSIGIGMIAGAIPAYRASKLKPVDALRYE
jgi:putative ABC transport system permease protein